jgi:PPOX class probable F420-dependent enzyme
VSTLDVEPVPISTDNLTGSRTDHLAPVAGTATTAHIPDSHKDLIEGPYWAALTTILPDGQPQSSLVWVDYDGTHVLINTALGRQKCRNMQANPKVTLLVVDPRKTDRWVEVRGQVAQVTTDGAVAHADLLAQRYMGKADARFYGDVYKAEWQRYETRVVVRIAPVRVSLDAIFR